MKKKSTVGLFVFAMASLSWIGVAQADQDIFQSLNRVCPLLGGTALGTMLHCSGPLRPGPVPFPVPHHPAPGPIH